ncbi:MAG: fimbria/pilus periplasmic chaperone [Neisseriaceae bacterium]|nr:fimbria/pilus periplasmic chaperone [Neisseriaceae bacterium]
MRGKRSVWQWGWLGCFCLVAMAPAAANVVITGTRVIYAEAVRDTSVHLRHTGAQPVLVQVWLDHYGADAASGAESIIPFVVTPPVFRMEPNEGQSVRILYTQEPLPQDRESLFQFNVLSVPPAPTDVAQNYLQLALASRLKFFFRPNGLSARAAAEAPAQLVWTAIQPRMLLVRNPTAFHVSVSSIRTEAVGEVYGEGDEGVMVRPFTEASIETKQDVIRSARSGGNAEPTLVFTYINDFGVAKGQEARLGTPLVP